MPQHAQSPEAETYPCAIPAHRTAAGPGETEITTPVALCLPNGRLNPDAVGWSRRPLHDTGGIGRGASGWGRNKRWEYWGVITPTHVVGMTISALDYATLNSLWVLDRATGEEIETVAISPLGAGTQLPGSLGQGPSRASGRGLALAIDELPDVGTRLRAKTSRVRLDMIAVRPAGQEPLGVVVPWSDRLFQYTVKDVARPAVGRVWVDDQEFRFGERTRDADAQAPDAWAVLDHGRGRWPYSMVWNWGAGSGEVDGHRVGIQIGGKWTEGTGSTENALVWNGRVHKISEELTWEYDTTEPMRPWHITGERADLTLTPFHDKVSATNLGVVASSGHQCFGEFTGWMAADDGTKVVVDGAVGWVEEISNRW